MPNYSSTMAKSEDAVAAYMAAFGLSNLSGVTVCKAGAGDEITLPCVVISADRIAPSAPGTNYLTTGSKVVEVSVKVITEATDSTRAAHDLICGDVEAALVTSQDQAVALMTAAAISGFTPMAWYFTDAAPEYSDNRRETVYRFQLEAAT